jgi:hypothetical protein
MRIGVAPDSAKEVEMNKDILKAYLSAGIAVLFLLACETLPAGFESVDEGVIRHTNSGMPFPPRVSGFDRFHPTTYDSEGRDVSVGYAMSQPTHCNITFYIYPASAELEKHAVELKDQIESHHKDAVLVSETKTTHEHSGVIYPGILLVYTQEETKTVYMGNAFFASTEPVESRAYLFIYRDWYMKYRITYPQEFRDQIDIYVSSFMKRLVWP